MNPASAKETLNKIDTSKISKATLPSIVKNIKDADTTADVKKTVGKYTTENPKGVNIDVVQKDVT